MRLSLCANLDGYSLRFVGSDSDELVATFRTFDQAAAAHRAATDALGMLAACLSTPATEA